MGFSIDWLQINGPHVGSVAATTLSYNWSEYKKIWYIRDQHGKKTYDVITSLHAAIAFLEGKGIKRGIPDPNNGNWGWGCKEQDPSNPSARTEPLEPKERESVFLFHLYNLYKTSLPNPNSYFVVDYDREEETTMQDGTIFHHKLVAFLPSIKGTIESSQKLRQESSLQHNEKAESQLSMVTLVEENSTAPNMITYYRYDGKNICVDSFAKCMLVYGLKYAKFPARAQAWLKLAYRFHDAPKLVSDVHCDPELG
jgi:hypothetical protein